MKGKALFSFPLLSYEFVSLFSGFGMLGTVRFLVFQGYDYIKGMLH